MAADRHTEHVIYHRRRLGRRPVDTNRAVLRLDRYLTGKVPAHPPAVDYFSRITSWCLGRNDRYGTCGPAALANLLLLVSTWLGDATIRVTDDQILDLYRRSGNPGFDPTTGEGDNGVDMTVMLSAALKGGIGGHYPVAFAAVNGHDPDEVWAAGALFGGTLWGADLDVAQQDQTDLGLWDNIPSAATWATWGGHAVLAAGRYTDTAGTSNDRTGLVTWAKTVNATDEFLTRQVPERYVVIWPWHLSSVPFLEGVNLTDLAVDYQALTHRPFPTTPPPAPTVDPDRQLIRDLGTWPDDPHIGPNSRAAAAIRRWRITKNL